MKLVVLKEKGALYTLSLEDVALRNQVLIVDHDRQPVAAVIPIDEYDAYRAWREAVEREEQEREGLEAFEQERLAFERLLPDLSSTHDGQWVAVYQGAVVESGLDRSEVLDRVYGRLGYVPV